MTASHGRSRPTPPPGLPAHLPRGAAGSEAGPDGHEAGPGVGVGQPGLVALLQRVHGAALVKVDQRSQVLGVIQAGGVSLQEESQSPRSSSAIAARVVLDPTGTPDSSSPGRQLERQGCLGLILPGHSHAPGGEGRAPNPTPAKSEEGAHPLHAVLIHLGDAAIRLPAHPHPPCRQLGRPHVWLQLRGCNERPMSPSSATRPRKLRAEPAAA